MQNSFFLNILFNEMHIADGTYNNKAMWIISITLDNKTIIIYVKSIKKCK